MRFTRPPICGIVNRKSNIVNQMIFTARQFEFRFPRPALVMGIVNVTPDSFSDGGKFLDVNAAVAHALKLAGPITTILLGLVLRTIASVSLNSAFQSPVFIFCCGSLRSSKISVLG